MTDQSIIGTITRAAYSPDKWEKIAWVTGEARSAHAFALKHGKPPTLEKVISNYLATYSEYIERE